MCKNRFNVGDHVVLFNSVRGVFDHDSVHSVLLTPIPVAGKERDESKTIAEQIEAGQLKVEVQYQTLQHGIVPEVSLFASEAECGEHFIGLLSDLLKAE